MSAAPTPGPPGVPGDSGDPHRPRWHFSPPRWMNDPIPFYWDGAYHLFYQHNPNGAFWGTMHWGHAVSRDLLRWAPLPVALAPTPGGPDADGVFTGCVVHAGADGPGGPAAPFCALYTGIPSLGPPLVQVQCLATSPDLVRWDKPAGNPVIGGPPPGVPLGECFRDPCVWRETGAESGAESGAAGGAWWMALGAEQPDRAGGLALLYRSVDLRAWEYRGVLASGRADETGHDFECPDLFPLDGRHVLLSSRGRSWWRSGTFAGGRFTTARWGPLDGEPYYAARSLLDGGGRRVLFGWLREGRPDAEGRRAGWSGVLALPRVLTLGPDGRLRQAPVPEVAALRRERTPVPALDLAAGGETPLPGIRGDSLEVEVSCLPEPGAVWGLRVRRTPDGAEGTEIEAPPGAPVTLRVFVDRSVVEAFADGAVCSRRAYPARPDALQVSVFCRGGGLRLIRGSAWRLTP